ncbi:MAG: YbaY family lipoprotein [Deltaproteobacteria bacterium]|nr:YbaY family lipoprotein [Deltaproteobacteria bacterium]
MKNQPIRLAGEIVFDSLEHSLANITVYVRLENVSLADAPSQVVCETVLRNVTVAMQHPGQVRFMLQCPSLDERASYTISVHADVTGSGTIQVGDYITMEHIPIGSSTQMPVIVRVRQV